VLKRTVFLIATLASPALAQVEMPRDVDEGKRFQVDFTGGVWFPRLEGITTLGAGGTPIDVGDLDLDTSQAIFSAQASIAWDRFAVRLGGFDSRVSGSAALGRPVIIDGLHAPAGTTINSRIDAWSINTDVSYDLVTPFREKTFPWSRPQAPPGNTTTDGRRGVDLVFSLIAGVQVVNLQQRYEIVGVGTATSSNAWAAPSLGFGVDLDWVARDTIPFIDRMVVSVNVVAGPAFAGGNHVIDLDAGVTIYILKSLGVSLGYRLSNWSLARGENSFEEGGLQGLFAGVAYTW